MADAEEFGAELTDFRERVAELRANRALPGGGGPANLDAALFELQYVSDVLWPRYEQLVAAQRQNARPADPREQQLLRAVFQGLPVPVVLLDRDSVVSRLNFAASQLFGLRAGYAAGRSITASFAHEGRAAFRGQVAAVARHEGSRSLAVELMHGLGNGAGGDERPTRLWVTLTAVRPPGHRRTAVLAVCQPMTKGAGRRPAAPGVAATEPAGRPDPAEVSSHVELMDLLDDMVVALLDDTGPRAESPLARACRVLHGRFADWVIADVAARDGAPEDGWLRRVTVLGPGNGPGADRAEAVAAQDPAAAPLIGEAARAGASALQVRPEDPFALGKAADGLPVLALTEASSLLCVPLRPPSGAVLGVLTLLRVGPRHAFELAEASAMERMSRHIALALRAA
ncbi:PAS domain-containing protein [Streptomyces litchfieldiae]|uniref:PAS domain-containing protein n=1 Tax=Streptomyces litchfieldiae TaxID=3075543 RepID=A0ABU2MXU8_9ACTN|nr:PAS domain-containing protein [Streptomyces sp. DSM 44938]MDT0346345.1 PAS domain-containing protein [Streptomyces sp. DSM 44938]